MADPINYTGVEYDPEFFQEDYENLTDYLKRIQGARDGGVLGTGTGVTATQPEADTQEPLGAVVQNCPAGYAWDGTQCVLVSNAGGSGSDNEQVKTKPASLESMVRAKAGASLDPIPIFSAFLPSFLGMAANEGLNALRDSAISDKLADEYTEEDIAYLLDNPDLLATELYSNSNLGFKQGFDIADVQQGMIGDFLDNIFGGGREVDPWNNADLSGSLATAAARLNPASNFMGFNPDGSMVANIGGTPMSYTYGMLGNTAAMMPATAGNPVQMPQLPQINAAANAAAPSSNIVGSMFGINLAENTDSFINPVTGLQHIDQGYGFGTNSSGDVGALNASGGVIGTVKDRFGNPVLGSDGTPIGGRNYSSGGSSDSIPSSGGGWTNDTVSSGGGNASRGYNTGGW